MEFTDELKEEDWCIKGHIGYVIEGRMEVDFNGQVVEYNKGDGICIPAGEKGKHKALVRSGERVVLILFEDID